MWYIWLIFNQNRAKKIIFSSRFKKGQEKAKWLNYFISRKPFQKRPNGNPDSKAIYTYSQRHTISHTQTWA